MTKLFFKWSLFLSVFDRSCRTEQSKWLISLSPSCTDVGWPREFIAVGCLSYNYYLSHNKINKSKLSNFKIRYISLFSIVAQLHSSLRSQSHLSALLKFSNNLLDSPEFSYIFTSFLTRTRTPPWIKIIENLQPLFRGG